MLKSAIAAAAGLAILSSVHEAHAQPGVQWNVQDAVLGGNGCSRQDTTVLASGSALSIAFKKLGVELPGGVAGLTGRSSCSLRVPITIPRGVYLSQLTQTATYGVSKTAGSDGNLFARSTFFNINVSPPFNIDFASGSVLNVSRLTKTQTNTFAAAAPFCRPNAPLASVYSANFAVTGKRDGELEELILFVDGLELRWDVVATFSACPP